MTQIDFLIVEQQKEMDGCVGRSGKYSHFNMLTHMGCINMP